MTKYKCQSCQMVYPMVGDAICPCGGDLTPLEMRRVDIPLQYPQLASEAVRITHLEWCNEDREKNCSSQNCIICEEAFYAGARIGKIK